MFDTMSVARNIKNARIRKNMTQTVLADEMGVSYQAVSNWERGNSMPDISKISDLCKVLDLSFDELMGNGEEGKTVQKIIEDPDARISVEEVAQIAPMLPPEKIKESVEENVDENEEEIDFSDIVQLAPFLEEEYLDELVMKCSLSSTRHLSSIVPFLSDKAIDYLYEKKGFTVRDAVKTAPFASDETLDRYVRRLLETDRFDASEAEGLLPFLEEDTVKKIVDHLMKKKDFKNLKKAMIFM